MKTRMFTQFFMMLIFIGLIFAGCESQYLRSAKVYMKQDNPDKAYEQLKLGTENEPANGLIWFELGKLEGVRGNYKEMNDAFAKTVEIDPTLDAKVKNEKAIYWENHYRNGVKLGNENKFAEALDEFKKGALIDPTKKESQFGVGWTYSKTGKHAEAVPYLEKAIELDPADLNGWHQLLYEYNQLDQKDKRIEVGNRLVTAHPEDVIGLEDLARAYETNKQDSLAVIFYEKAVTLKADDGNLWFNMGALYGSMKKFDQAVRCFRKTLELIPNDEDATYNLVLVLSRTKQFDEALQIAEKFIQIKPESPDGYRLKGDVYRSLAEKFEAEGNENKANEYKAKTIEAFKKVQELSKSGS